MRYISTRGQCKPVGFVEAVLAGLAPDGGLFVPETYPKIEPYRNNETYSEFAARVMAAFAGDAIDEETLKELSVSAYGSFSHDHVAPLVQLGPSSWVLELFHGPTLAFKDVAMVYIARLYDYLLASLGQRATILCATSGDTGGAAAAAFAGATNVNVVILHPEGKISKNQRLFMTTTGADNILNLAIDGEFDDCQTIVKELFADQAFKAEMNLSGVNSINWMRIAAQSVYYATAQSVLGSSRPLRFVVPSGNFGDALSGYVAARCGLINDFNCLVAVNSNDALHRLFRGENAERRRTEPTLSPAMDIQMPSNFERLLFDALERDGRSIATFYAQLAKQETVALPDGCIGALKEAGFSSERIDDAETGHELRQRFGETGRLFCPHTAVALAAARKNPDIGRCDVILATAHPAKFTETVGAELGVMADLPQRCRSLNTCSEAYNKCTIDLQIIKDSIRANFMEK